MLACFCVTPLGLFAFAACGGGDGASSVPSNPALDAAIESGAVTTIESASLQVVHGGSASVDVVVRQSIPRRLRISVKNAGPGIQIPRVDLEAGSTSAKVIVEVDASVKQGPVSAVSIEATIDDDSAPVATAPLALFVRGRPGERDTTFGTGGVMDVPDDFLDAPLVSFRSDNGFYFVAGPAYPIRRFDVNGNAVDAFGDRGVLLPRGGITTTALEWNGAHLYLAGMADDRAISVVRTDANGKADSTYGAAGVYRHPYDNDEFLEGLLVAPSGDLVLFGTRNGTAMFGYVTNAGASSLLSGDVTSSVVVHPIIDPRVLALGSSGAILLASGPRMFVIDPATRRPIAPSGTTIADSASLASASLDGEGRWVVAGGDSTDDAAFIGRVLPDGTPDRTFGTAGKARAAFSGAGNIERSPNGKLVQMAVVGTGQSGGLLTYRTTIARYDERGVLDTTFGDRGSVVFEDLNPHRVRVQPDNRILIVGKRFVRLWQ